MLSQYSESTPKAQILRLINELPDDSSFEDIEYELYVRHKIRAGMKDYEEGRTHTLEEVKERLSKWTSA